MAGNKKAGETLRQTMIEKYGSEEAWKAVMRENGRKGGSKTGVIKGFAQDKERARWAGAIGGRTSRRTKKVTNE